MLNGYLCWFKHRFNCELITNSSILLHNIFPRFSWLHLKVSTRKAFVLCVSEKFAPYLTSFSAMSSNLNVSREEAYLNFRRFCQIRRGFSRNHPESQTFDTSDALHPNISENSSAFWKECWNFQRNLRTKLGKPVQKKSVPFFLQLVVRPVERLAGCVRLVGWERRPHEARRAVSYRHRVLPEFSRFRTATFPKRWKQNPTINHKLSARLCKLAVTPKRCCKYRSSRHCIQIVVRTN